jgi:hypothetical protein
VAAVLENRLVVVMLSAAMAVGSAYLTDAALGHRLQSPGAAGGSAGAIQVTASSSCHLANGIEHVVYLEFANLQFGRDDPAVPSDLEQMPQLLGFLQANGTVLASGHTALASRSGGGTLSSLTGLYPDRHGQPAGDTYWSSPVTDGGQGARAPAPWPAFTRAGCDVGAAGGPGGMVLQNTAADLATVFGPGSSEVARARAQPARAAADYTGIAIHCAGQGGACAADRGGRPDRLPDEPGGYSGFNALYGQRYVGPRIGASGHLSDLAGRPVDGFPGFDATTPAVTLAYVAAMQEHAVPVTYAHLADPRPPRGSTSAPAPGEPAYLRQLHDYDQAFGIFLQRLARDGLTPANTLFAVSAGGGGYARPGVVHVDLAGMLAARGVSSTFTTQGGPDPAVWINGDPDPMATPARALEQAVAQLQVAEPATGTRQPLVRYLADRSEMRLLHMLSADQARTPGFVVFAQPGYLVSGSPSACPAAGCTGSDPRRPSDQGYAEAGASTAWLGLAGPGVAGRRLDAATWTDQADIRPTLLALTGLRDGYGHDGRVLSEVMAPEALPPGIRDSQAAYESVAGRLKQLDAPAGRVGLLSLAVATRAAASSSPNDAAYRSYAARMDGFTRRRDAVAGSMRGALEDAAFEGRALDDRTAAELVASADRLLAEMARA